MEEKKKKKKSKTDWLGSIGLTLILTAAALMVWFFLKGETVVTGEYEGGERSTSVSCKAEGINYPIFTFDESTGKTTETTVLFSDGEMKSISLIETLNYPDIEASRMSESHNHAAMNISFGAAGLNADAFNANYSPQKDKMLMTLYADADEFNEVSAKYFMANGLNKKSTLDEFAKKYAAQGFNCVKTE